MYFTHLPFVFRLIWRQKLTVIISLLCLSIGLSAGFIMISFVIHERSYDKNNEYYGKIHRILSFDNDSSLAQAKIPDQLVNLASSSMPEIEAMAQFYGEQATLVREDGFSFSCHIVSSDTSISRILSLPLISGSWQTLDQQAGSIILSEETANRLSLGNSSTGKQLTISFFEKTTRMTIAGIMRSLPKTSTFSADAIVPVLHGKQYWSERLKYSNLPPDFAWNLNVWSVYLMLSSTAQASELERKINLIAQQHHPGHTTKYGLQKMPDFYFGSENLENYNAPRGKLQDLYLWSTVTFLILFISSSNFITLVSSHAYSRRKELGIRKTIGANRYDLFRQIFGESLILFLLAFFISIGLAALFLPTVTSLIGSSLDRDIFFYFKYQAGISSVLLLFALFAGGYLAIKMSRCLPVSMIKNTATGGQRKITLKRSVLLIQMIVFSGLIASSIAINQQLSMMKTDSCGIQKDDLVFFQAPELSPNDYHVFKQKLLQQPEVECVTAAQNLPLTDGGGLQQIQDPGKPENILSVQALSVDYDFFETLGIRMVEGRSFTSQHPDDMFNNCIVNESLIKKMNLKQAIGLQLGKETHIVGVVKDFRVFSFHEKIMPALVMLNNKYINEIAVRFRKNSLPGGMKKVERLWGELFPNTPFQAECADDRLYRLHFKDFRFSRGIRFFTFLAVLLAGFSLIGITVFSVKKQVKEIGIRKLLGATVMNIFVRLCNEYFYICIVSVLISYPITAFLIHNWLKEFAYRVSPGISTFSMAAFLSFVFVFFSIFIQLFKAANIDALKSLQA